MWSVIDTYPPKDRDKVWFSVYPVRYSRPHVHVLLNMVVFLVTQGGLVWSGIDTYPPEDRDKVWFSVYPVRYSRPHVHVLVNMVVLLVTWGGLCGLV